MPGHGQCVVLPDSIDFEHLLADISSRLTDLASADVLAGVEASLRQIQASLGYDRCSFSEFVAGDYLNVVCAVAADGVAPVARGRFQPHLPWFLDQLRAGETVALCRLPQDLPPDAREEAAHCAALGLRSHLSIPLRVGGRVTSVLSFAAMRETRPWPRVMTMRLKTVGEMLAGAVALARAQEEARELRRRVWHADRVERVSALTAAIAHDLNQPLTAILSNAQAGLKYLQRSGANSGTIADILTAVVREEKRAAQTIRTMRALIRQDESRRERFALADAMSDVVLLLSSEFVGQGVRVQTRFDARCQVVADRAQIEQLVLNLLLNAAAATQALPPGRGGVWIEVAAGAPGRVDIVVRDAGKGIAPEQLERIFEPFWTTREEGMGLGLAICRSIVEAHGGRIRAESTPGKGATFHVELPRAADDRLAGLPLPALAAPAWPQEAPAIGLPAQLASCVAVIDDDDAVREGVVRLLSLAGWSTVSHGSADDFIASPLPDDLGCILLDVRMPGTSGLQLQRRLLDLGMATPLVFLTGHCNLHSAVDAMKLGAIDVLEKPVDGELLLATVRRAVLHQAARQEQARARDDAQKHIGRLSVREREILDHVLRGRLNKQIAADLLISEQTVKQHRGRVMEKMGVRCVADLVRLCEAGGVTAAAVAP